MPTATESVRQAGANADVRTQASTGVALNFVWDLLYGGNAAPQKSCSNPGLSECLLNLASGQIMLAAVGSDTSSPGTTYHPELTDMFYNRLIRVLLRVGVILRVAPAGCQVRVQKRGTYGRAMQGRPIRGWLKVMYQAPMAYCKASRQ